MTVAVFALLTVLYTWPLAAHPGSIFVHPSPNPATLGWADLYLTSWILSWGAHQLRTAPLHFFAANILHPFPSALAFSEHLLAGALLVLPVDVVHHNPILDHNLLLLASYTLGGAGTALLVRELGAPLLPALVAGALFAFGPLRAGQLGHVHALSTQWMPFTFLFLHRALRSGRWLPGVAFAASLFLVAASSVYYAYYFGIAVGLFLVLHALWRCEAAPGAYLRICLLGGLVVLALVPLLLPYADVRERFVLARDPGQTLVFSAVGDHYLGAFLAPLAYARERYLEGRVPASLIGFGAGLLALGGIVAGAPAARGGRRTSGFYLSLLLALVVFSLGPSLRMRGLGPGLPGPYALLQRIVPGFDALRVPVRSAAMALLCVAVLAGLGGGALVARSRSRPALGVAAACLVLAAIMDCWRPRLYALPVRWASAPAPVYRWLAAEPARAAVVELPFGSLEADGRYMIASTYHWRRLVNGYSGFVPAAAYLRDVLQGFPDARSLALLRAIGVGDVIVHPALLGPRRRGLCDAAPRDFPAELALAYRDGEACVLAIAERSTPPPLDPGRPLDLAGARLTTSSGDDAAAAIDGKLATHWVQPVDRDAPGWLQLDLPRDATIGRVRIRLGRHFGEYLRAYRVETSADGAAWTAVVDVPVGEAPVAGLGSHPDDLAVDVVLPATTTRHLRLVRAPARGGAWDAAADWELWGVHELELYPPGGTS